MQKLMIHIGWALIMGLITASAPVKRAGLGTMYQEAINRAQFRIELENGDQMSRRLPEDTCVHWKAFNETIRNLSRNYDSKLDLYIAMVEHFDRIEVDMPTSGNKDVISGPPWSAFLLIGLVIAGYVVLGPYFYSEKRFRCDKFYRQKVTSMHQNH